MTTATTTDWTQYRVGQVLYYVPNRSGREKESLTVKSVGRKYVRFENTRDDCVLEKGSSIVQALSYGPIGTVFESETAYQECLHLQRLRRLLGQVEWRRVDDGNVRKVAEIIGVEVE